MTATVIQGYDVMVVEATSIINPGEELFVYYGRKKFITIDEDEEESEDEESNGNSSCM